MLNNIANILEVISIGYVLKKKSNWKTVTKGMQLTLHEV